MPPRYYLVVGAVALATACASAPEEEADTPPEAAPRSIEEVRREIELLIGEARATDYGQCRLVALGERPCGGPRFYRAYSTVETDSAELHSLAEVYERLDHERNLEQGLVSTCEVLPRPMVGLRDGQCVIEP